MTVDVRPVEPGEHAQVGRLVVAAYEAVGPVSDGYRPSLSDTAARDVDGSTVLVAVDERSVLGTVTLVTAGSGHFEHEGHGDGGMRMLATAPHAQGRGIGGALVRAAVELASQQGQRRMLLSSLPWMRGAHRLYQSQGFLRRPDLDQNFGSGVGLAFARDLVEVPDGTFPPVRPAPAVAPAFDPLRSRPAGH